MSRKDKDAALSSVTYKLFAAMFDDVVMDHALEAHRYVAQSQMVCDLCNTICNGAHNSGAASSSRSRAGTPSASVDFKSSGMNTPSKSEGTVYLDCTVCSNQVASNRYAAHLTNCMGLNGARRGAARSKPIPDAGNRSVSPASDPTNISDDSKPLKGKGKNKNKRAEDAEFNLKRKRASPQTSPNKKQKQQKGSPLKSDTSSLYGNSLKSQSKIPSRLRESSTASFVDRSMSPSSRASSPGASVATPVSSYSQSPTFSSRGLKPPPKGTGPPKRNKHITPPLPPPPSSAVVDYMQDDAGEETGSSTDVSD